MSSTITTITISTIRSVDLAVFLEMALTVVLLGLLILKELAGDAFGARAQVVSRALNVALAPLLLGFILIIARAVMGSMA